MAAGAMTSALPAYAKRTKKKANQSVVQKAIPRWRGFNLQYLFTKGRYSKVVEDDFRWTSDWGFDFIRLPMSYRIWTDDKNIYKINEAPFERIDRVVEFGRKYNLHISLNFHRGPGYCINRGWTEPFDLWKDQEALDAFCFHWKYFAERYRGIPSSRLSFDLINEPKATVKGYERVVRETVKTIRDIDPKRLIIIDGLKVGTEPIPELADLKIGQSCRGYMPGQISHYRASWVDKNSTFPEPIWPGRGWDRKRLEQHYQKWADLAKKGVGVHCGECGCYNKTPYEVFFAWFKDVLEILNSHNIGFALWNLRGPFGVVDSGRKDAQYEDFHGHKLDRKLLELLQEFE
jgi:endoglucanase